MINYLQMWMHTSGAEARMAAEPNLYQSLLDKEHEPLVVEVIQKGTHTFYYHLLFI